MCLQVNTSGEESKGGIFPSALPALIEAVAELPRLKLRGLLALPAPETVFERQRRAFAQLARLAAESAASFDTLSIGTSGDL